MVLSSSHVSCSTIQQRAVGCRCRAGGRRLRVDLLKFRFQQSWQQGEECECTQRAEFPQTRAGCRTAIAVVVQRHDLHTTRHVNETRGDTQTKRSRTAETSENGIENAVHRLIQNSHPNLSIALAFELTLQARDRTELQRRKCATAHRQSAMRGSETSSEEAD